MSVQVPKHSTDFPCSVVHKNQPKKIEYMCHCGNKEMDTDREKKTDRMYQMWGYSKDQYLLDTHADL